MLLRHWYLLLFVVSLMLLAMVHEHLKGGSGEREATMLSPWGPLHYESPIKSRAVASSVSSAGNVSMWSGDAPQVLIAIVTTWDKRFTPKRRWMRQLLADNRLNRRPIETGRVKVLFFVGRVNDTAYRRASQRKYERDTALEDEMKEFGDIVVLDCPDDYRSLTHKTFSILRYSAQHYPGTVFTWKIDDDMYVLIQRMLDRIDAWDTLYKGVDPRWVFWGKIIKGGRPIRRRGGKWYLSHNEFKPETFENYADGSKSYLLGSDLIQHIAALDPADLQVRQRWVFLEDASLGMWVADVNEKLKQEGAFPQPHTIDASSIRSLTLEQDYQPRVNVDGSGPVLFLDFNNRGTVDTCERKDGVPSDLETCFIVESHSANYRCMMQHHDSNKCSA